MGILLKDRFTLPGLEQQLEEFKERYEIQEVLILPIEKRPKLVSVRDRICRFCKKDATQTSFEMEAHKVPSFIGNKYGIWDEECDNCNSIFSKYETDFAAYLGITRTLTGSVLKSDVPTLKSSNKQLEIRHINIYGKNGVIINKLSPDGNAIDWSEDDEISITYVKPSYRPLSIYKLLVKIALSTLPREELIDYQYAVQFILGDISGNFKGISQVIVSQFKLGYNPSTPFGYLLKKKNPLDRIPTHQFSFYFQDKIMSFCLPFNQSDHSIGIYNKEPINCPICPPLSSLSIHTPVNYKFTIEDFFSHELKKGEEQILKFNFDKSMLANGIKFDKDIGDFVEAEFDKKTQKGIMLFPSGTVFTKEDFKSNPDALKKIIEIK